MRVFQGYGRHAGLGSSALSARARPCVIATTASPSSTAQRALDSIPGSADYLSTQIPPGLLTMPQLKAVAELESKCPEAQRDKLCYTQAAMMGFTVSAAADQRTLAASPMSIQPTGTHLAGTIEMLNIPRDVPGAANQTYKTAVRNIPANLHALCPGLADEPSSTGALPEGSYAHNMKANPNCIRKMLKAGNHKGAANYRGRGGGNGSRGSGSGQNAGRAGRS